MHGQKKKLRQENVSGFRRVDTDLSHLVSGFDPISVQLGFKVDKVSFSFRSEDFGFLLPVSFHQCSTPIFIYIRANAEMVPNTPSRYYMLLM